MKFTVREVYNDHVVVDFEDGSWAQVPFEERLRGDRAELISHIMTFAPKPVVSWVSDIPLEAGEVVESPRTSGENEGVPLEEVGVLDYQQMRASLYPLVTDQLDAYYWAANGKPERLEKIHNDISEVKRVIPKGMAPMTAGALSVYLLNLP